VTPISFPINYQPSECIRLFKTKWPNALEGENFVFSSLKKTGYNCIGFALGEEGKDLMMTAFAKRLDLGQVGLSKERLNHSVKAYAKIFAGFYGFEECNDGSYEAGFDKIVLYEGLDEDHEISFSHVAIQVDEKYWKSKLAWCEDVEHTLDALNGPMYGHPVMFMKRKVGIRIRHFED
jgi:hypothetical protein